MNSLYFNSDATSPKAAYISSLANPNKGQPLAVTLGDTPTWNVFLVSVSSNAIDTRSGAAGYSLKVGLGNPGALPTNGTYTLTFGGDTTTALSYNSTGAQVQAALIALASIGANNIQVTGNFPAYEIQFIGALALAPQALITGTNNLLTPNSDIDLATIQTGSALQNAIQSLALAAAPVVLQSNWATITESLSGWNGTISFATDQLLFLFNGSSTPQQLTLEVMLVNPDGTTLIIGSPNITVYHRVIDPAAIDLGPFIGEAVGSVPIGNDQDYVTVTGLNLSRAPRFVICTVSKPIGGLNIYATAVNGTISEDGFMVELTGMTDTATYVLFYALIY